MLAYSASEAARAVLSRIGRTEDLRFSPDQRHIAISGFEHDRLLILGVEIEQGAGGDACVSLSSALEVESPGLVSPHGLAWLDEASLAVANRGGGVALFDLEPALPGGGRVRLEPVRTLGTDRRDLIKTPGSVAAVPLGLGLAELLVCNNYVHHVTRHLLDCRDGYRPLASELLLDEGLQVPDGIALSAGGRWLAVSNHDRQAVFVYRHDESLGPATHPAAVLRGMRYPHGLAFGGEDMLLVADAGAPFVHAYSSPDGEWAGELNPQHSIRVASDEVFARRSYNPQEGGPKGVDLADGWLMAITSDDEPLAFFDLRDMVPVSRPAAARTDDGAERARAALVRHLRAAGSAADQATEAIRRTSDRELEMLLGSRSWRLTAPLRRLSSALSRSGPRRPEG